uniref:Uncharacterized protein n=1 Tax=Globodera rostochiensis TaxID=31243 RepID=A0A914HR14_GLORO
MSNYRNSVPFVPKNELIISERTKQLYIGQLAAFLTGASISRRSYLTRERMVHQWISNWGRGWEIAFVDILEHLRSSWEMNDTDE